VLFFLDAPLQGTEPEKINDNSSIHIRGRFGLQHKREHGHWWGFSMRPFWNSDNLILNVNPQSYKKKRAGSRYFCESFYGHPCPTSGKNYATAHACGGPSRPASFVGYPTRGIQHHSRNDSTRFRKACIFTTQKDASWKHMHYRFWGLLDSCLAANVFAGSQAPALIVIHISM